MKSPSTSRTGPPMDIIIDGIGRLSLPLKLRAHQRVWEELSNEEQIALIPTQESKFDSNASGKAVLLFIQEDPKLAVKVEQWALEYTSKFVHAAGPSFYATTMAQILGTAYVKKKLPEVRPSILHPVAASLQLSPPCCREAKLQETRPYRPVPHNPQQRSRRS